MSENNFKPEYFTQDKNPFIRSLGEEVYDSNKVFSGLDIVCHVTLPGQKSHVLGSLNLLSISSHTDKFPVTSLGKKRIKGFTHGITVIGGTMVFASFDRSVWYRMIEAAYNKDINPYQLDARTAQYRPLEMFLPDDLPLFDISVTFVNESGAASFTGLIGCTIIDEGETYSVDNIAVMETYSYMAIDRIPFQPFNPVFKKQPPKDFRSQASQKGQSPILLPNNINSVDDLAIFGL